MRKPRRQAALNHKEESGRVNHVTGSICKPCYGCTPLPRWGEVKCLAVELLAEDCTSPRWGEVKD